jgi:hypothetical protein
MHRGSKSEKLVELICARSAYLHDGQRYLRRRTTGLTHDRTRSQARRLKWHLHETGHPHMEPPINPARFIGLHSTRYDQIVDQVCPHDLVSVHKRQAGDSIE